MIKNMELLVSRATGRDKWEEVNTCPLCEGSRFETYLRSRSGILGMKLKKCSNCSLIIQSPRLSEESLNNYYASKYRTVPGKGSYGTRIENIFERGLRRGAYICDFLKNHGINYKGLTVFEAGCGYGGILEQFKREGCKVAGCDIETISVKYAVSRGLDVNRGSLEGWTGLKGKVDIVILSHFLEHLKDPRALLQGVKELLKARAVLYIEVPGVKGLKSRLRRNLQPVHLVYYDLDTLCRIVEREGFVFVSGNEVIQGLFRKGEKR